MPILCVRYMHAYVHSDAHADSLCRRAHADVHADSSAVVFAYAHADSFFVLTCSC